MVAPPAPTSRCAGFAVLAITLAALAALGAEAAEAPSAHPLTEAPLAVRPVPLTRSRPDDPPLDQRWRARGVAFVDLPFGLRARYDAETLLRPSPGRELEAAFLDRAPHLERSTAAVGRARLLESRFTVSHALAHHVEVELSWATRSPLSRVDLLRIEDQRVAAMIRFVP